MHTTTLFMDYLLGILTDADALACLRDWATDQMHIELCAWGYISMLNCPDCPFDRDCNLDHKGLCAGPALSHMRE